MNIYPAIDILDKRAVRLKRGDYSEVTVYGTPLEMKDRWETQGARFIHIVDLNGARSDHNTNFCVIEELAKNAKASLQVGGGIRTMSDIIRYFDCGVDRVILGSACVNDPQLIEDAVNKYGSERIICGADAKNGKIAVSGWLESTQISLVELCNKMRDLGVRNVISTDISKDGMLSGSDTAEIGRLIDETGMNVIASGGINSIENLKQLKQIGAYGAILGVALYENKISLADALRAAEE